MAGALTVAVGPGWVFLINIPIGLIGILLVNKYLPDWHQNATRRMDFVGFFLAGITFAGWVFGLSVLTLPALPALYGYLSLIAGTIAAALYWWHYKRTDEPLLDLSLFRRRLFRITVVAGAFFRFGTGAMPFLFPLMLQIGFGLNAFQSGMVTFATAVGAFAAKFFAEPILHRMGFRPALLVSTALTALGVFGMAVYSPSTPMPLMMAFLVLTGFVQSIFWTATNAFTFADIPDAEAGQANVMSQVAVQLSLAVGVALGGGVLEGMRLMHGGGEPLLSDFHWAFWVIGGVTLISTALFLRLPKGARMHAPETDAQREAAAE